MARAEEQKKRSWLKPVFRLLLLTLGISAVVALVLSVGVGELWSTLKQAGIYLPLIILLNAAWVGFEGFALWSFLGKPARKIPWRVWLRAAMTHYSTMVVLPVGRAGAEVARATVLAPYVTGPRASAGALRMQGVVLIANTLISIPCALASAIVAGPFHELTLLLALNGVATLVGGTALSLALHHVRIGGWLGRKFEKMAKHGPEVDEALRERPHAIWGATAIAFGARTIQTLEYGIILLAVSGGITTLGSLLSQGIHLVGAGLGDFVPNQVGVMEGAYRFFAKPLGLGDAPQKALAIALLARMSNLTVALGSFLALQLWPTPKD